MKTLTLEQFDQRTKTFDSDLRGSMYAVKKDWGDFKPSRGRRRVEVKKGKVQHNKQQRIKAAKAKQAAAAEVKKIDRLKKDRGNNKYLDLALSEYEADCAILGTQPVTMYNPAPAVKQHTPTAAPKRRSKGLEKVLKAKARYRARGKVIKQERKQREQQALGWAWKP